MEGTSCYCDAGSAAAIRRMLDSIPLGAVHLLGSGDMHYVSLFFLERIQEPFSLVCFDHHSDDKPTIFGDDVLSCGSWVREAVRTLPQLSGKIWVGSPEHPCGLPADLAPELPPALPVYVSVDLDVLSPDFVHTNWDQGEMTLDALCSDIERLFSEYRVLGVDICGGINGAQGATAIDKEINAAALKRLLEI